MRIEIICPVCEGSGVAQDAPNIIKGRKFFIDEKLNPNRCLECKGIGKIIKLMKSYKETDVELISIVTAILLAPVILGGVFDSQCRQEIVSGRARKDIITEAFNIVKDIKKEIEKIEGDIK